MGSRRHFATIGRFILAVLLFAHAAVVLAACEGDWRAPAQAVAAAEADGMDCCPESGTANLCVAHCTGDAQNVEPGAKPSSALPATGAPVGTIDRMPGLLALRGHIARPGAIPAPPRNILFGNLRI